jgi:hypothetical protein
MTGHDKLWLLLDDRGRQVAELDLKLDVLDAMIQAEKNHQLREVRERLERLGLRADGLRPLRRHQSEERTSRHLQPDDDVERLVAEAKTTAARRPRDPGLLRRPAIGQVLGVR